MEASEYDDAITDVADIIGVSEDKREAFGLAMKRLVMACSEGEEE
jgi:Arc/MetJ family transcription regulator